MTPEESRKFTRHLSFIALGWLALGTVITFQNPLAMSAFFQVYFITALDLMCLILMFWQIFFGQSPRRTKQILTLIFFTFKLVCLGLLAITLKRLRNAPTYALVLGLLFIVLGPILAGVWGRMQKGNLQRESKL
jgi:hypothetical protein